MVGKGTKLMVGTAGSPNTYAAVGKVVSMVPFEGTGNTEESTDLDATAVEVEGSIPDFGTLKAKVKIDVSASGGASTLHATLESRFLAQTKDLWAVDYAITPARRDAFEGVVTGLKFGEINPKTAVVMVDIEIKISGTVVRSTPS